MRCVVTGAAGFIGSHLCEALQAAGHEVVGLDAFTPCYPEVVKQRNLLGFLTRPNCRFFRAEIGKDPVDQLLAGAEVIFHLAALAGPGRGSVGLEDHWENNVLATERLLQAAQRATDRLRCFVLGSTSWVYGTEAVCDEAAATRPGSAYAVTKQAAESLALAHGERHEVPVVVLRYCSVYGPRQRPDQDWHGIIQAVLRDQPVTVYADARKPRAHLYVADCVQATTAAVGAPPGEIYNVGGSEMVTNRDVLRRLEALAGHKIKLRRQPARQGRRCPARLDTAKLRRAVGWEPRLGLEEGLGLQWIWQASEWKAGAAGPVVQPPHGGAAKGSVKPEGSGRVAGNDD